MRTSPILLVAAAFMAGCADAPTASLLAPGPASFETGKAPPPWAAVEGDVTTDGGTTTASILPLFSRSAPGGVSASHSPEGNAGTYRGWLLVSPGGQAAILRFADGGTNVTFSNGARIMKVNGKVTGHGTMTVGGHAYDLGLVDKFDANGDCAATAWDYDGQSCASFSAEDGSFRSHASVWTGVLSNTGGDQRPPPDCGKECVIICPDGGCYISDTNSGNTNGGRR